MELQFMLQIERCKIYGCVILLRSEIENRNTENTENTGNTEQTIKILQFIFFPLK